MTGGRVFIQAQLPRETSRALSKSVPWGSRNVLYERVFAEVARICAEDPMVVNFLLAGQFRIEIETEDH